MESIRKHIGRAPSEVTAGDLQLDQTKTAHRLGLDEESAPLTKRERNMTLDLAETKRALDVANSRVAVMMANNGALTHRPIMGAIERMAELDRRILALADMNDESRQRETKALFEDVKTYAKARATWLESVDAEVAKRAKK